MQDVLDWHTGQSRSETVIVISSAAEAQRGGQRALQAGASVTTLILTSARWRKCAASHKSPRKGSWMDAVEKYEEVPTRTCPPRSIPVEPSCAGRIFGPLLLEHLGLPSWMWPWRLLLATGEFDNFCPGTDANWRKNNRGIDDDVLKLGRE